MSFPREVRYISIKNVVCALHTPLQDLNCFVTRANADGLYTMETLGVAPVEELGALRHRTQFQSDQISQTSRASPPEINLCAEAWEFGACVSFSPNCESVGLRIRYGACLDQNVLVYFRPAAEEMVVDRSASTTLPGVNTQRESGPHTLFYRKDPSSGSVELEKLHLRLYKDGSVLELYANDRFALSTRIYPETTKAQTLELYLVGGAEGDAATATWENVQVWDMETEVNDVQRSEVLLN